MWEYGTCLPVSGLFGGISSPLAEMLSIGRHWGWPPRHGHRGAHEGCRSGCKTFCCILVDAGRAVSRQACRAPCRQQWWLAPLGEHVSAGKHKYNFSCRFCSVSLLSQQQWGILLRFLDHVLGWKMVGQQTRVGNVEGAGQVKCHLRTTGVHCTVFKCSAKGD